MKKKFSSEYFIDRPGIEPVTLRVLLSNRHAFPEASHGAPGGFHKGPEVCRGVNFSVVSGDYKELHRDSSSATS